jgi:hypothetical protein
VFLYSGKSVSGIAVGVKIFLEKVCDEMYAEKYKGED